MSATKRKDCPECGGAVHEIQLVERAHFNQHQAGLLYALPEAKRGFWSGTFPVEGEVAASMCEQCGRILLYGTAGREE